jgi:hypothetical protein
MAMAAPMPRDEPVTNAILFSRGFAKILTPVVNDRLFD